MKTQSLLIIGLLIVIGFGCVQDSFGQCTDVPTTPEIGVYNTFRLDYDYRLAEYISSSNPYTYTFLILQWWGCCIINSKCNISITTAYGTQPTRGFQSTDGMECDFAFTDKGKYIVGATHPGFANCGGGTAVRLLNFFIANDPYDLDADGWRNWEDCNIDGDELNNDVDDDDDNDDLLDNEDYSPGGQGTAPYQYPSDWSDTGGGQPTTGTPTAIIPTPTVTPTPTVVSRTITAAKHPECSVTLSAISLWWNLGASYLRSDDDGPNSFDDVSINLVFNTPSLSNFAIRTASIFNSINNDFERDSVMLYETQHFLVVDEITNAGAWGHMGQAKILMQVGNSNYTYQWHGSATVHEYGHNCNLSHRSETSNIYVMSPSALSAIGNSNRINYTEANAYLNNAP